MLRKIKKKLKYLRDNKYKKILLAKEDIVLRKKAINYICKLNPDCESIKDLNHKDIFTKNQIRRNFLQFYKKFNANIKLKKKYHSKTLKKKTDQDANFEIYILFTQLMMKNKSINSIQKLNTILKINDLLIFIFDKKKHLQFIPYFKRNIFFENKLLKLYL